MRSRRGRPPRDRASEDAHAEEALADWRRGPRDGLYRQRELTEDEQDELVVRLGLTTHAVDEVASLHGAGESA